MLHVYLALLVWPKHENEEEEEDETNITITIIAKQQQSSGIEQQKQQKKRTRYGKIILDAIFMKYQIYACNGAKVIKSTMVEFVGMFELC